MKYLGDYADDSTVRIFSRPTMAVVERSLRLLLSKTRT